MNKIVKSKLEEWSSRTSSGQNPTVSTSNFSTAIRAGNNKAEELMRKHRAAKASVERNKITSAAREKSWKNASKRKKNVFESLNGLY